VSPRLQAHGYIERASGLSANQRYHQDKGLTIASNHVAVWLVGAQGVFVTWGVGTVLNAGRLHLGSGVDLG
jgi:hypothetical protein